eukprot:2081191-Lingulodinium_polyedra.AAC.1
MQPPFANASKRPSPGKSWSPRSLAAGMRIAPGQPLRASTSVMSSGMLPSSLARSVSSARVNG